MNKQLELIYKYPNSRVVSNLIEGPITVLSINKASGRIDGETATGRTLGIQTEYCKLELTPLEDITEEDKREFEEKYYAGYATDLIGCDYSILERDEVDWLREKSYNIDDPNWEYSVRKKPVVK